LLGLGGFFENVDGVVEWGSGSGGWPAVVFWLTKERRELKEKKTRKREPGGLFFGWGRRRNEKSVVLAIKGLFDFAMGKMGGLRENRQQRGEGNTRERQEGHKKRKQFGRGAGVFGPLE